MFGPCRCGICHTIIILPNIFFSFAENLVSVLLHYFGLFSFSVAFTEKSFTFQGHLLTFKEVNVVGVVFKLKTKRVMYTAETETDG